MCEIRCCPVVGGDFSVHSPISHRELVKSWACRLPGLISRNVFSTAVIIILDTQARANPLSCSPTERERERQNTPLTAHMSVFQQQHHVKEEGKKGGMTCLKLSKREKPGLVSFNKKYVCKSSTKEVIDETCLYNILCNNHCCLFAAYSDRQVSGPSRWRNILNALILKKCSLMLTVAEVWWLLVLILLLPQGCCCCVWIWGCVCVCVYCWWQQSKHQQLILEYNKAPSGNIYYMIKESIWHACLKRRGLQMVSTIKIKKREIKLCGLDCCAGSCVAKRQNDP